MTYPYSLCQSSIVFPHEAQLEIILLVTENPEPVPEMAMLKASGLSAFLGSLIAWPRAPYLTAARQFALSLASSH
jgi:hypothetical protein